MSPVNAQETVVADVGAELTKAFRGAAQMGRYLADRRRAAQREAQQASAEQARALREATERERRMAEPVYRRAMDDRFWESAQPQDAAFVYGVAARFSTIDPMAAMAARRCENEANARWGVGVIPGDSTEPQAEPVTSEDLPATTTAVVAPALDGEENRDWSGLMDEAAASDRAEKEQAHADAHVVEGLEDLGPLDAYTEAQQDRDEEASRSQMRAVLDKYPEVDHVVVTTVGGFDAEGHALDVADFAAFDKDGKRVPEAADELNQIVDDSWRPEIFVTRMAGHTYTREELGAEADMGLMRAAAKPNPDGPKVSRTKPKWDTAEARDEWASEQLDKGTDPQAVRAARTGDLALSQPATEATKTLSAPTTGRRPKPTQTHGRKNTLGQ